VELKVMNKCKVIFFFDCQVSNFSECQYSESNCWDKFDGCRNEKAKAKAFEKHKNEAKINDCECRMVDISEIYG
jgi:hypothetical protein